MDPVIFRENDIRGRAGVDISLSEVFTLGLAVGTYFQRQGAGQIVVGRDTRPSSRSWLRQICRGLAHAGCAVVDIDSCLAPCLHFAVGHLKADGGVMVTASHNAAEYNGLKMVLGSNPLCGSDLREIYRTIEDEDYVRGQGREERADILEAYVSALCADLKVQRPLRVGIDAGHGTAGEVARAVLEGLGVEVVPLRTRPVTTEDGHFLDPAHEDDLQGLQRFVRARGLDLAVAYDGDGDRLGVVGPTGAVVRAEDLLILFARGILHTHPGAAVVGEVMCSQRLFDEVARLGGRAIMWKTGHSLVRQKMIAEGALLAGDPSGHFFFADRYPGFDDAIYATGRLLEILSASPGPLPRLLSDLPSLVASPPIRISCDDGVKQLIMPAISPALHEIADRTGARVVDFDGVRISWPDGWAVVRASNTEPAIVVRCEAADEARLESIRSMMLVLVQGQLRAHPTGFPGAVGDQGASRYPTPRTTRMVTSA